MQQVAYNTMVAALRLVCSEAEPSAAHAQEVPGARDRRAGFARSAPAADRGLELQFRALNDFEGRLVPAAERPAGVLWRLHGAATTTDSSSMTVTGATGAALALPSPGARP